MALAALHWACAATVLGLAGCGDDAVDACEGTGSLPSDSLEDFTQKCFDATEIEVPAFNCDDGTEVPETNLSGTYPNQTCDAPNVLNGVCDPGSKFQILAQTNEAIVVAHCRKKGLADGFYGDIAVIQYNKVNGATCFYQALGNLPAAVTAPSEGIGPRTFPWQPPDITAGQNCVKCHDNGPLIRSPYLAQLRDVPPNPVTGFTDRLPGTNADDNVWGPRFGWNKSQPYSFVGNDFQSWKVEYLTVQGVSCMNCHRMAVSKSNGEYNTGAGSALDFGPKSTAETQLHKNPHSEASPIWMKPDQVIYLPDVEQEAALVRDCALGIIGEGPVPAGCTATEYGIGDTCDPEAAAAQVAAPPDQSDPAPDEPAVNP
jgi:hypothetical protein